jgi:GTP-binding protein
VHLVDVSSASGRDPVEDFDVIQRELELFDPKVAAKPMLVCANKIDALDEPDRLTRLETHVTARDLPFFRISGVTGEGTDALLEAMWRQIVAVRAAPTPEADGANPDAGSDDTDAGPDLIAAARQRRDP